jgi:MoaA/NifB/PqqE/SkfB family radical SAM enzyme
MSALDTAPLPAFVQIEPVGECNLACAMCPVQYRHDGRPHGRPAFMPFATITRLLEGFGDAVRELHLQGLGEPLMHPDFVAMVRHAVARGIAVSTNTNLTLLTEARAEALARSGIDTVHVSIDGASAPVYESIRVGASLAKVRRNLHRLVRACALAPEPRPKIRLVTVVMRRNLHELADIVRLACDAGVPSMFVQHLCHDYGEDGLPTRYSAMRAFFAAESLDGEDATRVRTAFDAARATARVLGIELRLPRHAARDATDDVVSPRTPFGRASRCDWPWRGAYLSYRGEAMPCCMVSTPDRVSLGDMAREGVAATWDGEPYRDFRSALASDAPPAVCRSCSVYRGAF